MNTEVFYRSILAGCFSAVMILSMKQMNVKYAWTSDQVLLILFMFVAPLYFTRLAIKGTIPHIFPAWSFLILALAVGACFMGNILMFSSVFKAANPAYAFLLGTGTSAVIVLIGSVFIQGASISTLNVLGIVLILAGAALLRS